MNGSEKVIFPSLRFPDPCTSHDIPGTVGHLVRPVCVHHNHHIGNPKILTRSTHDHDRGHMLLGKIPHLVYKRSDVLPISENETQLDPPKRANGAIGRTENATPREDTATPLGDPQGEVCAPLLP